MCGSGAWRGPEKWGEPARPPRGAKATSPIPDVTPWLGCPGRGREPPSQVSTWVAAQLPTQGKARGHSLPPRRGDPPRGPCGWGALMAPMSSSVTTDPGAVS